MILSHHGITPQISPSAYIQQSAHLIGDVHTGDESSVCFNAVVRGDVCYIRIGKRVNIQDNATIHVFSGGIPTLALRTSSVVNSRAVVPISKGRL
jgi:gamma-carbonic anhydrase